MQSTNARILLSNAVIHVEQPTERFKKASNLVYTPAIPLHVYCTRERAWLAASPTQRAPHERRGQALLPEKRKSAPPPGEESEGVVLDICANGKCFSAHYPQRSADTAGQAAEATLHASQLLPCVLTREHSREGGAPGWPQRGLCRLLFTRLATAHARSLHPGARVDGHPSECL